MLAKALLRRVLGLRACVNVSFRQLAPCAPRGRRARLRSHVSGLATPPCGSLRSAAASARTICFGSSCHVFVPVTILFLCHACSTRALKIRLVSRVDRDLCHGLSVPPPQTRFPLCVVGCGAALFLAKPHKRRARGAAQHSTRPAHDCRDIDSWARRPHSASYAAARVVAWHTLAVTV